MLPNRDALSLPAQRLIDDVSESDSEHAAAAVVRAVGDALIPRLPRSGPKIVFLEIFAGSCKLTQAFANSRGCFSVMPMDIQIPDEGHCVA